MMAFSDIPEWEAEARLAVEVDLALEAALDAAATMTFDQQLALLDSLGIDYSAYLDNQDDEPEPEEPSELSFEDLFK